MKLPAVRMFVASCLLYAAVTAWTASALPRDRLIPTHWSFSADPDGWSSWGEAVGFLVGLGIFLGLTMALVLWLPAKASTELMNLPHKQYWIAPERLAQTRAQLTNDTAWLGVIVMVWAAGVGPGLVATVDPPHHIPWWSTVGFVVFLVVLIGWAVLMTRRWKRLPARPSA